MMHKLHARLIAWAAVLLMLVGAGYSLAAPPVSSASPIVIGHRGAAGYLPEHTLPGYALAVFQGADFIEPDLVMTMDGQLIARHEPILDETTDVSAHPEFASRRTTKMLDGFNVTAWWSEDFTLAEIKQLKARERIPSVRPANARINDQVEIPTLQEVIDLAKGLEKVTGRKIGIYPETKHPTYFRNLGFKMEETLVATLRRNGYEGKRDQVFIQSFEIANLKQLAHMTNIPLIQLLSGANSQPFDVIAAGGTLTYGQMATAQGLADVAKYAAGIGPTKGLVIPVIGGILDPANVTSVVHDAHAVGLLVHPYTFRVENQFLPLNLRIGADPNGRGNLQGELQMFLDVGIDGFFTDNTDVGVKAVDAFIEAN